MARNDAFRAMLDRATERSREADRDWSKNPGGIDFTPGALRGSGGDRHIAMGIRIPPSKPKPAEPAKPDAWGTW